MPSDYDIKKGLNVIIDTTVTNDTLNNRINIAIPTTTSLVKASTSAGVFLFSLYYLLMRGKLRKLNIKIKNKHL